MAPRFLGRNPDSPAGETPTRFPKRLMHMFPELSSGR